MPFTIKKYYNGYFVVNLDTNKRYNIKPHKTKDLALKHMQAIAINYYLGKKKR